MGRLWPSLDTGPDFALAHPPPPSLPEPRKPSSIEKRPFLRGSCRLFSTFPVSADNNGLSGRFLASSLCTQNSVPGGRGSESRGLGNSPAEKRASSSFGKPI